ncbi:hypothetical protein GCM10023321_05330 [Pseudonocardia eucalypti]|uniref:Uncharacterized protein n=1 Tax=Pseudonocardia eucalypti TaxID=648755 RepID=A0ABP9PGI5_9PSEU
MRIPYGLAILTVAIIVPNDAPPASECVKPAGMTKLLDQDPDDEQVPWKRTGPGNVNVYFDVSGITPEWRKGGTRVLA